MMGQEGQDLFKDHTLMVNSASPVVKNVLKLLEEQRTDDAELLVQQVYDLAMLSHQAFDKDRMERFLERSHKIMEMVKPS